MVSLKGKKTGDLLLLANGLVLIVLVNMVASVYFFRIDLTEEKRYSIKQQTKSLLQSLDDKVYIEVFLEGELNAGFRRFQKSVRETLEEFRIYSGNQIQYSFVDPTVAMSEKARNEFIQDLAQRGVTPVNVVDRKEGETATRLVFPGALISYGGFETGVMLLKGNKALTPEEEINQSIEGAEYELASAIYKLSNTDRKRVGLVTGHGELDSLDIAAFNNALLEVYDVFKVDLSRKRSVENYDALVIAKPQGRFSESDKYKLDQYIMNGGNVMFLIDKLQVSMDSASRDNHFAIPYDLNLDDMLFKYGIRINSDLIQDRSSALYPVVIGQSGSRSQVQLMEWPFFPLVNHYGDHLITRNIDAVVTRFVSSVDTVKATGVMKTPLLMSSQFSRTLTAPVLVSVSQLQRNLPADAFTSSFIPMGYLLEGRFNSLYQNRFLPESVDEQSFREESDPTKIVVIADGDLARNEINPRSGQPLSLGFDPSTNYTFANEDLLMNAMAYLVEEDGLIRARNKEIKIRPLDREQTSSEKLKWQLTNLLVPLMILITFGVIRSVMRRRKYARF